MLLQGDVAGYLSAFHHYGTLSNKVRLAFLIWVVLLLSIFFLVFRKQYPNRTGRLTWLPMALLAVLPLLLIPYQLNYMALTAALLLVLFARLLQTDSRRLQLYSRWLIAVAFGFIAFFQLINLSRDLYVAYRVGPAYEEMNSALADLRPAPGEPPLRVIAPYEQIFLFYEQEGFEVIPWYETTVDQALEADLLVFNYTGDTDPLHEQRPAFVRRLTLEPLFAPDQAPPRITLFGRDVTKGTESWIVSIYRPMETD